MVDKVKVCKAGTEPSFPASFDVTVRKTLNFTDIVENNNKYYNIELQSASGGKKVRVYTQYGRVGAHNPAREYRPCDNEAHANAVIAQIIKEKTKKGYEEVELVKSDLGSEVGKAIVTKQLVTEEQLKKNGYTVETKGEPSKLHAEVRSLVGTWFGATAQFIELNLDTKKCPLGQLSVAQLAKGRDLLDEARKIVHQSKPDESELNRITSKYYANIPHNFGYGRLDADLLRFDDDAKIDKGFDILDIFADAKNAEKVMSTKSPVDAQYETLNADLEYIDPTTLTYKWLQRMLLETRAGNHSGLGKLQLHRAFTVNRKKEEAHFLANVEQIAKECGKQQLPDILKRHVPERPDVPKELQKAYERANVIPVWHGTRRANMVGITTKGLLIRPSGVPHAGSMFGDGIYWAAHSTKSINYTDVRGSYWAAGQADKAFLFLADCAFGNQRIVHNATFIRKGDLKGDHSVWAKMGQALLNDELIVYNATGPSQQHRIKYILEFSTGAR
jgi:poly [ADP-ribose] polymerase